MNSVEPINKDLSQWIDRQSNQGVLVLISGPSGAGKDTLMNLVLSRNPNINHFVTTTTRAKRPGEVDGKDYHFISRHEFEKLIAEDAFFEWVEYRGNLYGGQKKHLEQTLSSGHDVIWRLDVRGIKNIKDKVKQMFPYSATVFITPPSMGSLVKRLKNRNPKDDWLNWNLKMAVWEMKRFGEFDYLIVNRDNQAGKASQELEAIIKSLRLKIFSSNLSAD